MLKEMKRLDIRLFPLLVFAGLLCFSIFLNVIAAAENNTTVYFFNKQTCPYCKYESVFLDMMADKYPELVLEKYDIYYNHTITDLFEQMCKSYGTATFGVPKIFIGDQHVSGYTSDDTTGAKIENMIREHLGYPSEEIEEYNFVTIPFIGQVKTSEMSLPVLTIVIGMLDGFNPCAIFILCFLLVFLIGTKSRKKVFIIGGVFIFISGLVYFLFISVWFNFFVIFKYVPILKWIVASIVIFAGLVNMKDYFYFQQGISFTLPKKWKSGVMNKMKKVAAMDKLPAMILGVIAVAFVVNIVELMCTIGFPMIYTQILSTYNFPATTYYLYILFYCIAYMIDDFLLFSIAVLTLDCIEMTKKRVRIMKLISGILMILLAIWFVLS